jgi:hypothetical protein
MSRRRDKGESGHYSRHCKRWLNTMPESDKHIWVHVRDDDMAMKGGDADGGTHRTV